MEFSIIDIVVGSLVVILGLKGILNGMVKEVFGLLGIAGGIFIASSFSAGFGGFIDATIYSFEKKELATLIGFVILLAISWAGILALGALFSKLTKLSGLGIYDRIFGVMFASSKVFVIFSVMAYAVSSVDVVAKSFQDQTDRSFLYPMLKQTGGYVVNIDPDMFEPPALGEKEIEELDTKSMSMEQLEKEIAKRMQEGSKELKELEERMRNE